MYRFFVKRGKVDSEMSASSTLAQGDRRYGARARIGLLVPSPNTVAETEFWRLAPKGVSVHTSRMPIDFKLGMEAIPAMEQQVPQVMAAAITASPTVIAYGCTASSAVAEPDKKQAKLQALARTATITAAMALLDALAALESKRIALLTPYPPMINDKERQFFENQGLDVIVDESVIVDDAQLQMRNMCMVPPRKLVERAIALVEANDIDAVVLSCCDMPTLDAIKEIECTTNKPVISSTQALFWRSLREAGISDKLPEAGRLMTIH